jgi:hypothetical protein
MGYTSPMREATLPNEIESVQEMLGQKDFRYVKYRLDHGLDGPNEADIYVTNILQTGVTNPKESALYS